MFSTGLFDLENSIPQLRGFLKIEPLRSLEHFFLEPDNHFSGLELLFILGNPVTEYFLRPHRIVYSWPDRLSNRPGYTAMFGVEILLKLATPGRLIHGSLHGVRHPIRIEYD